MKAEENSRELKLCIKSTLKGIHFQKDYYLFINKGEKIEVVDFTEQLFK